MFRYLPFIRLVVAIFAGLALPLPWGLLKADDFTPVTARDAAAKGDAQAQFYLSRIYARGEGVPQDYTKAVEYLRASAEQGYARAENNLAAFYAQGLGLPQDQSESTKWFRKAAEQGDPLAEYSLGMACQFGRGQPTNLTEAVKWYQQAAAQNLTNALLALGDLYLGGKGVAEDYQKAGQWFVKAASLGSLDALNSLGFIEEMGGMRVDKNPKQAATFYRRAAEKGLAKAQMNLGRMYLTGTGVDTDFIEAYKWFHLAQSNGEGISWHYLQELEDGVPYGDFKGKPLTREQIKEALRRAGSAEQTEVK